MRLEGRPATTADVMTFYPEMTSSFRAWVCELDGEVQGIIGVALVRPLSCMFSAFREALRPYLRHPAVLRLIKKAEAAVRASRVPVLAIAQANEPTAPAMLERLGFSHAGEYEGEMIYQFTPGAA